jgi:hypothetical protein
VGKRKRRSTEGYTHARAATNHSSSSRKRDFGTIHHLTRAYTQRQERRQLKVTSF